MKAARVHAHAADSLSGKQECALGLLVGVVVDGYACVYHCIFTPPAAVKLPKTLDGILNTALDDIGTMYPDWLLEHSRQVSHLLPGGLSVLGLFVTEADPSLLELRSNSQLLRPLTQLLAELCAELTLQFAVLYCASSRHQHICRLFEGSHPRLIELSREVLPDLLDFQCLVPLDLAYCGDTNMPQVALQALLEEWTDDIKSARVTTRGEPSHNVSSVARRDLTFFYKSPGMLMRTGKALCRIYGTLDCRVSVHPEQKLQELEGLLKNDLLKSLRIRLELLDLKQKIVQSSLKPASLQLPRRVIHRADFNMMFCDYLSQGETLQDSEARLIALAGVKSLSVEAAEVRLELPTVAKPGASYWPAFAAVLLAVVLALLAAWIN